MMAPDHNRLEIVTACRNVEVRIIRQFLLDFEQDFTLAPFGSR